MRYRLVVLDVDGTLLDSTHILRPRVAAAVRATQAAGLHVALATGKLLGSVVPLMRAMDLSGPQIVLNGAAVMGETRETREPLRFCPLREADRRAVIATVRACDPTVLVSHFALDGIYMDEEHPRTGIFADYGEGPPVFVSDLLGEGLPPAAKILLSGAPSQLAALRAQVTPLLAERVTITTTTPDFLEFFDPAAGKGQALVALRAWLGIPKEAVVAVGDGENDLSLLAEAGLAVAMGNAAPALLRAADRVMPSNDDDGAALILEELAHEALASR